MHAVMMDRQRLVGSLRGQKFHVPDFRRIFAGWPSNFNPELEALRHNVDERLKSLVEHQYKDESEKALALQKLRAPNYALFGAYWWPYADERTLHTMTYMAIWIALWDDVFELEAGSFDAGALANEWEAAQNYRYETLLYIRQTLNLPTGSHQERPNNIFITSFDDISAHVNSVCDIPQKERLYHQLEQHVLAVGQKQRLRLSPKIPTVNEYLEARMAASGVRTCATLLEICQADNLSPTIRQDPLVQRLLDQINILILVTNDMCSLKSKLARGSVDNLVALLWLSHADLDSAVEVASSVLEAAKADFDETSQILVEKHAGEGHDEELQGLIAACRAVCTGNLVWSLSTRRYDLQLDERDHSRTIVL